MSKKFIVDFMLGRLMRWLRLIGEDAEFLIGGDKNELVYRSLKEKRIILTRSTKVSRRKAYQLCFIKSENIIEQIKQLIEELGIEIDKKMIFSRCIECNNVLVSIDKKKIKSKKEHNILKIIKLN